MATFRRQHRHVFFRFLKTDDSVADDRNTQLHYSPLLIACPTRITKHGFVFTGSTTTAGSITGVLG